MTVPAYSVAVPTTAPAELLAELPPQTRRCLDVAANVERMLHAKFGWYVQGVLLVFSQHQKGGPVHGEILPLTLDPNSRQLVDLLRATVDRRPVRPDEGVAIGGCVIASGLDLSAGVSIPTGLSRAELAAEHDRLTASGQARMFNAVIGALRSGWRWRLYRYRSITRARPASVQWFPPGAPQPPNSLAMALDEVLDTLDVP